MPLRDDQNWAQTLNVGQTFLAAALGDSGAIEEATERQRTTARIQGALVLALGVEIGFFNDQAAARILNRLQLQPQTDIDRLGLGALPLVSDRIRQLAWDGFVTPGYRPRLTDSDSSRITFRSVVLPITRAWQKPLYLPAFFDRTMFGNDVDEHPVTTTDALRYLDTATEAIRAGAAGDWLSRDEPFGADAWLVAELASLYQLQIDTSRPTVKTRLLQLAEALVRSTLAEARDLIHAEPADKATQAAWLLQLEQRAHEWRAEALAIVQRFDTAMPAGTVAARA